MSCKNGASKGLTLSKIKILAENYANKKNVTVCIFKCSEFNFCEEKDFIDSKYKLLKKIYPNGEKKI